MKMKKYIKYLTVICSLIVFTSCLVDDEAPIYELNDQSTNLASFARDSQSLNAVTNGDEYVFDIVLTLIGPTSLDSNEDIPVTFSIDPSSTAIENVHFRFETLSTTLLASNNHIASIPITMITDGILAPLDENPVLILNIESADGTNVLPNANSLKLTFVYQCFADLSGTYLVTNDFCDPSFTTTIEANPDGSWYIGSADGGFLHQCTSNTTLLNPGSIVELCGQILPTGELDYGSANFSGAIGDISGGTWDAENGILTMYHTEAFFTAGPYSWISTYTRQ